MFVAGPLVTILRVRLGLTGFLPVYRFLTSFICRPLPIVPLFLGVTATGDSGSVSSDSLFGSCMLKVRGDFVNRPSGPRGPVPLLFGSCISETGLLMFFLCIILLSAVVTVWFVPDIANWVFSEQALPNFSFVYFFP